MSWCWMILFAGFEVCVEKLLRMAVISVLNDCPD